MPTESITRSIRARFTSAHTSRRLALRRKSASRIAPSSATIPVLRCARITGWRIPASGGTATRQRAGCAPRDRPTICAFAGHGKRSDEQGAHLLRCALLRRSRRVPHRSRSAYRHPWPRARPHRQGARRVRGGRPARHRRDRPHLRLRLRARIGHPGQGAHPDAVVGVLVRSLARHRPQPRDCARSRRTTRRRPASTPTRSPGAACWCGARRPCQSSAWRAVTWRAPAGRNTRAPGSICGIPLPQGLREADRLPRPLFTPATKAESGHDENISAADAAARHRRRRSGVSRTHHARPVRARRGARRIVRHHPRRHEVRVRVGRRAGAERSDPD